MNKTWNVAVDAGGTFTDLVAYESNSGEIRHLKVPSSRKDPADGLLRALDAFAAEVDGEFGDIRIVIHGTTLVTNSIVEGDLATTALVTTAGFRDVLEIGRHWRGRLYDPFLAPRAPVVPRDLRFELNERITAQGDVIHPVDPAELDALIAKLKSAGVDAVAVAFLHSYQNPANEEQVVTALRESGQWQVSGSTELSREHREFERTSTTVTNAALMPVVDRYIANLEAGLDKRGVAASLLITQSNGGALTPQAARMRPVSLAMSGPAGGVVACAEVARSVGYRNVVGFDMGGTTTDVSIIRDAMPEFTRQLDIGELPIRLPSAHIRSIGSGGGSIASVDSGGALTVGPKSAGADPGPACYGWGGAEATLTDCHLVLGRLDGRSPLGGRVALDTSKARGAIENKVAAPLKITVPEAAAGVVEVANASMERAVRVALRDCGEDPRDFALLAFGGAGALHAAELARRLGMSTVIVPPVPGTLSALGFLMADVRLDFARSGIQRIGSEEAPAAIAEMFADLEAKAVQEIDRDISATAFDVTYDHVCDVRYVGQAYEIGVPVPAGRLTAADLQSVAQRFHELHERAYAFSSPSEPVEVVTCRLAARVMQTEKAPAGWSIGEGPKAARERSVYVPGDGFVAAAVYDRGDLPTGVSVSGPAVIHQADATTFVPSFARAEVRDNGSLVLSISPDAA
jgi:N-methylhydantoinase A